MRLYGIRIYHREQKLRYQKLQCDGLLRNADCTVLFVTISASRRTSLAGN
jgi:hypothetical protein